jgi:hypothetical protein
MSATLVSIRQQQIGGRKFFHNEEIPPGLLTGELLDYWLDHKMCCPVDESHRRSLYRMFPAFSGLEVSPEKPFNKEKPKEKKNHDDET